MDVDGEDHAPDWIRSRDSYRTRSVVGSKVAGGSVRSGLDPWRLRRVCKGGRLIKRGDQVTIIVGTYAGCTGQVIFIEYREGRVTVGLDQHPMMLKTEIGNITSVPCNILPSVV